MPKYADGSFSLINSNTGLLRYRYYERGELRSVYGYSKKECFEKRFVFVPPKHEKKPKSMSFSKWSEKWIAIYKAPHVRLVTLAAIRSYLDRYLLPAFGSKSLVSITPLVLQTFLNGLPCSNTRDKIASYLSDCFSRAFALGLVPSNPYLGVSFSRSVPPLPSAMSHREQLLLLNAYQPPIYFVLTLFLLFTGLRPGEALALVSEDIDVNRLTISVTKSRSKLDGSIGAPKTRAGVRVVPFCSLLLHYLQPFLSPGKRIFELNGDTVVQYYCSLFHRLGLPYSCYVLRHTFITNAYELAIPSWIVQRWVGHSKAAQAAAYLALRDSIDFVRTPVVGYMLELKARAVPNLT